MTVQAQNPTGSSPDAIVPFKVALEGVVYTLVDVHEGHDAAFEDWYENDHFYAGGVLAPYVLSGRRWYASRALRAGRFVSPACPLPDGRAGTNLATYFVTAGGLRSFYDWINPQLVTLRSGGRMFADRTHVNTDGYRLESILSFPGASGVPAHVVGDHPFAGLFVAYLDASGGERPDESAALPAGTLALSLRPNVGSLTESSLGLAAAQRSVSPRGDDPPSTPRRGASSAEIPAVGGAPVRLVMAFLTEAPQADPAWSAGLAGRVARLTGSAAIWGGGFRPVVPGSRAHLAELR
jgi:hypothetical protein